MGMYDTVWFKDQKGEDIGIQFKCGDSVLHEYEIGEAINIKDGIYFEHEACFVVYGSILVAAFSRDDNQIFNKWGGNVSFPEIQ